MPDLTALRRDLVDHVRAHAGTKIADPVAEALRVVPRHLFLPQVPPQTAYQDEAVVTKLDQAGHPISSSSQPTIMALMLDQLSLAPGHRVLEIGAGTGYNAALMAHLVGADGEIVSIDIDQDIADQARINLAAAGYPSVTVVRADGAEGYADRAPYDRIIATVGVWDLAPAWLAQLAPGGRIVVPIDVGGQQRSVAFEPVDGHWASRSVVACGFMRLRGASAGPETSHTLDGLTLSLPGGGAVDRTAVLAALSSPPSRVPTGTTATKRQLFEGVALWLATTGQGCCLLSETLPATRLAAPLATIAGRAYSVGVLAGDGLAVLAEDGDEVTVLGYGPAGAPLARRLAGHVQAWAAAGYPGGADLRIDAYPVSTPDTELPGRAVLVKTHTKLALSW